MISVNRSTNSSFTKCDSLKTFLDQLKLPKKFKSFSLFYLCFNIKSLVYVYLLLNCFHLYIHIIHTCIIGIYKHDFSTTCPLSLRHDGFMVTGLLRHIHTRIDICCWHWRNQRVLKLFATRICLEIFIVIGLLFSTWICLLGFVFLGLSTWVFMELSVYCIICESIPAVIDWVGWTSVF